MTLYLELLREHRRGDLSMGDRPVSIAAIKAAFPEVGWRRWQDWRERADCAIGAQRISKLSALKLWMLAGSNGAASDDQIVAEVGRLAQSKPSMLKDWLESMRWEVQGKAGTMNSINAMAPDVDVIHRQRLYEWWRKAGMRYSTANIYSHAQIARAVSVARVGAGKGRPRQLSFF